MVKRWHYLIHCFVLWFSWCAFVTLLSTVLIIRPLLICSDIICHCQLCSGYLVHHLVHPSHFWILRPFGYLVYQIYFLSKIDSQTSVDRRLYFDLVDDRFSFYGCLALIDSPPVIMTVVVACLSNHRGVGFSWAYMLPHSQQFHYNFHILVWFRHRNQRSRLSAELARGNVEQPGRFGDTSSLFL